MHRDDVAMIYSCTDSRVLSKDIGDEIPNILNGLYKNTAFKDTVTRIKDFGKLAVDKSAKRFMDDSKVTDHYVIIPTY